MSPDEIARCFPKGSAIGSIVEGLISPDEKTRRRSNKAAVQLKNDDQKAAAKREAKKKKADDYDPRAKRKPGWTTPIDDATGILHVASTIDFPIPSSDAEDGLTALFQLLWESPKPEVLADFANAYERVETPPRRCALLTLLCRIYSKRAKDMFLLLIRKHGWPNGLEAPFFEFLPDLIEHAKDELTEMPALAPPHAEQVAQAIFMAFNRGKLETDDCAKIIEFLSPVLQRRLEENIAKTQPSQQQNGIGWRYMSPYSKWSYDLYGDLRLADNGRATVSETTLRAALAFTDPWINVPAAIALLRRGKEVSDADLDRIGAGNPTRKFLFEKLEELGLVDRFPKRWRTWDAFALADFVSWISYPGEMGCEPDAIELMQFDHNDSNTKCYYLWRFEGDGMPWTAALSGPYDLSGEPRPLFAQSWAGDDWDSKSPKEHIEQIMSECDGFR